MTKIYLGLGTNLGNKDENLCRAINYIDRRIGKVFSQSAFHASEPWGFVSEHTFLNAVVGLDTDLSPVELLEQTQQIEAELGRINKSVDGCYTDRLIDIDILLYGDEIIDRADLRVPHPLMTKRTFVMEPMAEIAPDVIHPLFGQTIFSLYLKLKSSF